MQVYADGTLVGSGVIGTEGSYTVTTSVLAEGTHAITVTYATPAGVVSATSTTLNVTVDTTVSETPVVDLNATSDTGSSTTDNLTGDTTPTFTGMGAVGDLVQIYAGSLLVGTDVVGIGGHYSVTTSTLAKTTHVITAKFTDVAGNVSAISASLTIVIDTTEPTVISGSIATATEVDMYPVVLGAGDKISVSISTPGDLDSHLRLFDAWGMEIRNC